MDYQNRAGSKKGGGGIASASEQNMQQRRRVESILTEGMNISYTFQNQTQDEKDALADPYIFKNHQGKLVCKLCNTMHVSWTSVMRHLKGKKHGLNVIRRGEETEKNTVVKEDVKSIQFRKDVEEVKKDWKKIDNLKPQIKIVNVKDEDERYGMAIEADYSNTEERANEYHPMIRIVSGLELRKGKANDRFIVVAYEFFENVAIQIISEGNIYIPKPEIDIDSNKNYVDDLNRYCTYWDDNNKRFYIQLLFNDVIEEEVESGVQ